MYGFKKRAGKPRQQSFANGGPVLGPGSGTSDDVKDAVPPGTYIMPADSTRAMGAESLSGLGFHPKARAMAPQGEGPKLGFKPGGKVPVNLSNGEFQLSPEQVHAIGAQVLDQMKGATHKQVEQDDEQVATDALYFANGGLVEDERMRRTSSGSIGGQDLPYKDMQRVSFGKIGDQPIPNDAFGDLAKPAQAPAGATAKPVGFVAGAFPNTSMAIQSSFDSVRDAQKVGGAGAAVGQGFRSAMTPAIGFADDVATGAKRLLDGPAQALKTFATGDATPIGQDVVAAPAKPTPAAPAIPGTPAAAAASNPIDKPSATAPAVASPAASAATVAQTTAAPSNNVTREGNSFSGQNIGAGFTINGQQPRTGGYVAPAEYGAAPASSGLGFQPASLRGGGSSPDVMGILQRESQIRQSMAGLQDQVAFNEGTGGSFRKTTNEEIVRDMLVNGNSRDRASALGFMAGNRDAAQRGTQTEQELALRQQDLQGRQGIANEDLGLRREAQGFQTAAQRQVQALQQQYIAEADPAKRNELARQLTVMQGKAPPDRFLVAGGGQEFDPGAGALRTMPARVFDSRTGAFVDQPKTAAIDPKQQEGATLRGKDGKLYRVTNGMPVAI